MERPRLGQSRVLGESHAGARTQCALPKPVYAQQGSHTSTRSPIVKLMPGMLVRLSPCRALLRLRCELSRTTPGQSFGWRAVLRQL